MKSFIQVTIVILTTVMFGLDALAQSKNVEQALSYRPVQSEVDYEKPSAASAQDCKLVSAKSIGKSGFVLVDKNGRILRMFLNNGGDRNVDQWSYFKDGIEVYRDIDSDFDGKADEFRWLGEGGTRWGVDLDGDNIVDQWKSISPEEVSIVIVEAVKKRNFKLFQSVLLSDKDLAELGLSEQTTQQIKKRLQDAKKKFDKAVASQKLVKKNSQWVYFGSVRPALIPAGTGGSKKDVHVYENVAAVIETGEDHGQLSVGTLVKVGNGWKTIDIPQPVDDAAGIVAASAFFIPDDRFMAAAPAGNQTGSASNPAQQKKFEQLEVVENKLKSARQKEDAREIAKLNNERTKVLQEIANLADDGKQKSAWIRQFADTVAGAFQAGDYPDGLKAMSSFYTSLKKEGAADEDLAYLMYRRISAQYSKKFDEAKQDEVADVQKDFLDSLGQFVKTYPESEQSADAMLQLALWAEFSPDAKPGDSEKWYKRIVDKFPESESANKARGALVRLTSEGKRVSLTGQIMGAGRDYKLSDDRDKVVLIHYWESAPDMDYSEFERIYKKYRSKGFNIVNINLESDAEQARAAVKKSKLPGIHLYDGGKAGKLSNQLGIALVPTMLLIDREGKVADRNVRLRDLEKTVDKLVK